MASYVCLFVLCLVVAVINGHVIRTEKVKIPNQGMTIEISIRPEGEEDFALKTKDIIEMTKDAAGAPKTSMDAKVATNELPSLERRLGIVVGLCPDGYVQRGGFCFPDYD